MITRGQVLVDLEDVPDPGGLPVQIGTQSILVLRSGDLIRAYINNCPHQNRPLCLPSGKVIISESTFLVCPFHGASFDIESGTSQGGPAGSSRLDAVIISVEDGQVIVRK